MKHWKTKYEAKFRQDKLPKLETIAAFPNGLSVCYNSKNLKVAMKGDVNTYSAETGTLIRRKREGFFYDYQNNVALLNVNLL